MDPDKQSTDRTTLLNIAGHFPAGTYLAPRGKGATDTMGWKNGLMTALMRGYSQLLCSSLLISCWLLGSSPFPVQGSHLPAPNIFFSPSPCSLVASVTSLKPDYIFLLYGPSLTRHTSYSVPLITDISWIQHNVFPLFICLLATTFTGSV